MGEGKVVKGWDEGVGTMRVGSKRQLAVPANLAYGADGIGEIPPGAALQFEVELVGIKEGIDGFFATFPGGKTNFVLVVVLALSFIPYFLPPEIRPGAWK